MSNKVSNTEVKDFLEKQFGFEISEFIVLVRNEDGENFSYTYKGDAIILAGLASWFVNFINSIGLRFYTGK